MAELPLGIELAASWVEHCSDEDISRGQFAQGIARLEAMVRRLEGSGGKGLEAERLRFQFVSSLTLVAIRYRDYGLAILRAKEHLARADALGRQYHKIGVLLDLALAEQFAGLYEEAVEHNLVALALAEEMDCLDDVGLLKANLCLTLRGCGEPERGLEHGLDAAEILASLGLVRIEGQCRNRVGHCLLALERWAEAEAAYAEALAVWEPLRHPNRVEAVAGRAVAAVKRGQTADGVGMAQEVLDFVIREGLRGVVEPVFLLLNCAHVLTASSREERAQQVLRQAESWVTTTARRISDDEVRRAFLYRPDNQRLSARLAASL